MMIRFRVTIEMAAIIEVDQSVIDRVDDEWRSQFYDLSTPDEIVGMIAEGMMLRNLSLSDLDGWADLSDGFARCVPSDPDVTVERL